MSSVYNTQNTAQLECNHTLKTQATNAQTATTDTTKLPTLHTLLLSLGVAVHGLVDLSQKGLEGIGALDVLNHQLSPTKRLHLLTDAINEVLRSLEPFSFGELCCQHTESGIQLVVGVAHSVGREVDGREQGPCEEECAELDHLLANFTMDMSETPLGPIPSCHPQSKKPTCGMNILVSSNSTVDNYKTGPRLRTGAGGD